MKTHESKKANLTWESLKNCELQMRFKLKILWVLDQTELLDSGLHDEQRENLIIINYKLWQLRTVSGTFSKSAVHKCTRPRL